MGIRMRTTRGHAGNRRSHHRIASPRLSACAECGAMHLRHRMCSECGSYREKKVVDMAAKKEKEAMKVIRKRRRMGLEDEKEQKTSE